MKRCLSSLVCNVAAACCLNQHAAPSFNDDNLRLLFAEFGTVHRAFIVRSRHTSESEGYGFVELACPGQATAAKSALAAKIISDRSIRVDWVKADSQPQSVAELRSRTLFIDKLPRTFVDMKSIETLCNKMGTVTFCKLATSSSGGSRGFAFVDFADVYDAVRNFLLLITHCPFPIHPR